MQRLVWGLMLALNWVHRTTATTLPNEHKVPYIQNIVLYPDKHSWCKTTEIKQIVAYPGCSSVEIDNSVCVGACFSYSIPKTSPSAPGEVITPYCDSCQPSLYTWKEVKLTCKDDSGEDEDAIVELTKKVQVITNCSCSSCQEQSDSHRLELQKHAELNNADVPELMSLMLHHKKTPDEEIEQGGKLEESALEAVELDPPLDLENVIDVDEEKEKEVTKEVEEEPNLEVLQLNHNSKEAHLVPGPHHSLVLKPDLLPEHHIAENAESHRHQAAEDEDQVPSLLQNQFKIHDDEEFLDQLAVESRKEFDGKPAEVLTVPELIYKSWNTSEERESENKEKPETETGKTGEITQEHHQSHESDGNEKKKDEEVTERHQHHHSHHHFKQELAGEDRDEHKVVKIVEVSDHHLKPAVEGAQLSYVVKNGETNIQE